MSMKDYPKLTEFFTVLEEKGFTRSTKTVYDIFDGSYYPKHTQLSYGESEECNMLFNGVKEMFDYEHIESEGGNEGEGEYCYGVIRLGGDYYKAEWNYYSHDGCEYDWIEDTIKKVTPKQKTITVYE